jgi:hypothetical protein
MRLFAAVLLARDVNACDALLRGYPVPRHRLMPGVLTLIGFWHSGKPVILTEDIVRRVDLASPSPTDKRWRNGS